MAELVPQQPHSPVIQLPDARLQFVSDALPPEQAQRSFGQLLRDVPWSAQDVVVWGKRHRQPRLVAWFADPGMSYTYSGSTLQPLAWTPALRALRARVQTHAPAQFNSVLLNLYRDQHDGMGWHSDDESELGEEPVIASLSLGAARIFQMKHRLRPELGVRSFELTAGSVLVMSGPTQRCWRHALRKESRPVGPRINLTFRTIVKPNRPER